MRFGPTQKKIQEVILGLRLSASSTELRLQGFTDRQADAPEADASRREAGGI